MSTYDEQTITRITDTYTDATAIITSDEQLRQVLEGWEDMSEPGVAEAVDALVGGGTRDPDVLDLGIEVDEFDPDDEEVSDAEWAEWICSGWLADGRVWDDGRVVISDYQPPVRIGGQWEWMGGPVSVRSHHGDQEHRWRRVSSLADLRAAVATAHAEEQEWQDGEDARQAARADAEVPLMTAAIRCAEAERAAETARAARDGEIRRLLDAGWTGARVAVLAGISAKQVSLIRNR